MIFDFLFPGLSLRSNPGLKLANAFGVYREADIADAFGVYREADIADAFDVITYLRPTSDWARDRRDAARCW